MSAVCRANKAVQDSKGVIRHDSSGGASKALFKKLPGVGPGMAKRWYDLGCRCAAGHVARCSSCSRAILTTRTCSVVLEVMDCLLRPGGARVPKREVFVR